MPGLNKEQIMQIIDDAEGYGKDMVRMIEEKHGEDSEYTNGWRDGWVRCSRYMASLMIYDSNTSKPRT